MTTNACDLAIKAVKRHLDLLDKQLGEASQINGDLMAEVTDPDQSMPFWITALDGVDGEEGINIVNITSNSEAALGTARPSYGVIRTDQDAAFILSSIFVCAFLDLKTGIVTPSVGPQMFVDAQAAGALPSTFALRLVDQASGRLITLGRDENGDDAQALTPIKVFGQSWNLSQGGLVLPTECTLPRNTSIRVEAFSQQNVSTLLDSARLHVVFHGRKVVGG